MPKRKYLSSKKVCDVTQLHYLIDQSSKHDLESLSSEFLGRSISSLENAQADIEEGSVEQQIGNRLKAVIEIGEEVLKTAIEREVLGVYEEIDFPLFEVLSEMENNGIALNVKYLAKYQKNSRGGNFTYRVRDKKTL